LFILIIEHDKYTNRNNTCNATKLSSSLNFLLQKNIFTIYVKGIDWKRKEHKRLLSSYVLTGLLSKDVFSLSILLQCVYVKSQ